MAEFRAKVVIEMTRKEYYDVERMAEKAGMTKREYLIQAAYEKGKMKREVAQ